MSVAWGDLNARARGLARHLVGPEVMRQLADAPDLAAFVRAARAARARGAERLFEQTKYNQAGIRADIEFPVHLHELGKMRQRWQRITAITLVRGVDPLQG